MPGPVEYQIFGPPGTGKTTDLSQRIRSTCRKFGTSSVMVLSFTRTAAVELVGRDIPLGKDRVGTLHSFAYRALGHPKIAETAEHITSWNKSVSRNYQIHGARYGANGRLDDPFGFNDREGKFDSIGNKALSRYSNYRTRMLPIPSEDKYFGLKWEEWKTKNELLDFTDLIIRAYETRPLPPVAARVLYADEVQDFSPLEMALVRRWGESMDYIVLSGDDDQCIFSFRGAVPDSFLNADVPDDRVTVLPLSYRLPQRIKDHADRWISKVAKRRPKTWKARETEDPGTVQRMSLKLNRGGEVVDYVRQELERSKETEGTVMILASCGFMLDDTLKELKLVGIPFHNPYRLSHGAWNPGGGSGKRVLAFLCNDHKVHGDRAKSHTWGTVAEWFKHVDVKKAGLRRGAKKQVVEYGEETPNRMLVLSDFLNLGIDPPPRGNIEWLSQRLRDCDRHRYSYALQICRTGGARTLTRKPRVIVGTVHSVKGGEATSVILFPDLSRAGSMELNGTAEQRDAITRIFYVGMTRARERLTLCEASDSSNFVEW